MLRVISCLWFNLCHVFIYSFERIVCSSAVWPFFYIHGDINGWAFLSCTILIWFSILIIFNAHFSLTHVILWSSWWEDVWVTCLCVNAWEDIKSAVCHYKHLKNLHQFNTRSFWFFLCPLHAQMPVCQLLSGSVSHVKTLVLFYVLFWEAGLCELPHACVFLPELLYVSKLSRKWGWGTGAACTGTQTTVSLTQFQSFLTSLMEDSKQHMGHLSCTK